MLSLHLQLRHACKGLVATEFDHEVLATLRNDGIHNFVRLDAELGRGQAVNVAAALKI